MKKTLQSPRTVVIAQPNPIRRYRFAEVMCTCALCLAAMLFFASPGRRASAVDYVTPDTPPTQVEDSVNDVPSLFGIRLSPSGQFPSTFTVPAGKRLVITQVSGFTGSSSVEYLEIDGTFGTTVHSMTIPWGANTGTGSYIFEPTTFYANPGTIVTVRIADSDSTDTSGINMDIVGHYVPV